jgi:hypothetical protein
MGYSRSLEPKSAGGGHAGTVKEGTLPLGAITIRKALDPWLLERAWGLAG